MRFKTSYFSVIAVFQCYLLQGKNYIYVVLLKAFFPPYCLFGQFYLFLNYIFDVFFFCEQDDSLQNRNRNSLQSGGESFLEIWTHVNVYEMILILGG